MFKLFDYLLDLPRFYRFLLVIFGDLASSFLGFFIALCLTLGSFEFGYYLVQALVLSFSSVLIFYFFGVYRIVYRHGGFYDVARIIGSFFTYASLYFFALYLCEFSGVPILLGFLQPVIYFLLFVFLRISIRFIYNRRFSEDDPVEVVLIYGAGSTGRLFVNAVRADAGLKIFGYLDDDVSLQGRRLNGLEVYSPSKLADILSKHRITAVYLALPSVPLYRRKVIIEDLFKFNIKIKILPKFNTTYGSNFDFAEVKELDIDDLLGRDKVQENFEFLDERISGKVVLITGAGGSIGSELCRQLIKLKPEKILLLEVSEFALYKIHSELDEIIKKFPNNSNDALSITLVPLLCSVTDKSRINHIFELWGPDIVYHAAAYKHVPLVEYNVSAAIVNNVWGTLICAEAAIEFNVKYFVLISTDKAVRPTNVMGASKRLAELILQALDSKLKLENKFSLLFAMVRFGNVLGSSGSVVPLFREQIKRGGPITLTHPEITRYFMTIPEAAQLVIHSGCMAEGGDVFLLDMGSPVRIYDLAVRIIQLSGLRPRTSDFPDGDIDICITGLRPGEKLYEELLISGNPIPTRHTKIHRASEDYIDYDQLMHYLSILNECITSNNHIEIREVLRRLVQDYAPTSEIADLYWSMRN